MEVVKTEINGSNPLPQRPQKNQPAINKPFNKNQQNDGGGGGGGGPAEKKPRFSHPGAGGPSNQSASNKVFQNKGFGNRNRNRGGSGNNQNKGGGPFQNSNLNSQNQSEQQQLAQQQQNSNQPAVIKTEHDNESNVSQQSQQQQQQQQNQNKQHHANRNSIGSGSIGGGGMNQKRDHRNRGGRGIDNRGGPGGMGGIGRNDDFFISQRLRAISGPTHELPPIEQSEEVKFSGRNRLYVGNLTNDVTEVELRELFKPFGEIGEVFSNPEKNFAFLKLDYHNNAERAKRELDGTLRKGRNLRVRFAPNATILRVSNLTGFVSNELLYKAFEVFGPVERASITVDDRGKPTGDGVVEFSKKSSANMCLRYCSDKCFFLTASLRPCVVEPFEPNEDTDGLPDKALNKKSMEFNNERSVGPRFADVGSFEHEYGTRWKQLHELYKTKQEALKRELKMEEEKLEAQMEYARYEHETELLRQELRKRESDNERKKMEWEMREKQAEEMRKREEEQIRRTQNEMQSRMLRQEEEMRRRQQENTLFMQAQQLNSLLDQQESGFSGNCNFDNFAGNNSNSPFDFRGNNNNAAGNGPNGPNGPNNQQDYGFNFGDNPNQGSSSGGGGGGGGGVGGGGAGGGAGNNARGGNNSSNNNNNNNNPWERRRRF